MATDWTKRRRAKIARRWPSSYTATKSASAPEPDVEASLHELCHAATFNIDVLKYDHRNEAEDRTVDEAVGRRFENRYQLAPHPYPVVDWAANESDRKEAQAIAIQLRVARVIGLKLSARTLVEGVNWVGELRHCAGLDRFVRAAALIRRQARRKDTARFERRVLVWLAHV